MFRFGQIWPGILCFGYFFDFLSNHFKMLKMWGFSVVSPLAIPRWKLQKHWLAAAAERRPTNASEASQGIMAQKRRRRLDLLGLPPGPTTPALIMDPTRPNPTRPDPTRPDPTVVGPTRPD